MSSNPTEVFVAKYGERDERPTALWDTELQRFIAGWHAGRAVQHAIGDRPAADAAKIAALEADLAALLKGHARISIPTEVMEQEFQIYFRRGFDKGRADLLAEQAKAVPFRPPNFEETLDMMELTGGSFVRALAAAMYRADAPNRAKLVAAFPEYLREYSARALLEGK